MELTKSGFRGIVTSDISRKVAKLLNQDYFTTLYRFEQYNELNALKKYLIPIWIEHLYGDYLDVKIQFCEVLNLVIVSGHNQQFDIPLYTVKDSSQLIRTIISCISFIAHEYVEDTGDNDARQSLQGLINYQ